MKPLQSEGETCLGSSYFACMKASQIKAKSGGWSCAISRAINIARASAMKIDERLGKRLLLTWGARTAAAPAASLIFEQTRLGKVGKSRLGWVKKVG